MTSVRILNLLALKTGSYLQFEHSLCELVGIMHAKCSPVRLPGEDIVVPILFGTLQCDMKFLWEGCICSMWDFVSNRMSLFFSGVVLVVHVDPSSEPAPSFEVQPGRVMWRMLFLRHLDFYSIKSHLR